MEIAPVEILEEILALSLPPVNQSQAPGRTTLALVCHRWNAVVQETPLIWSKISSNDKLSQVEKSLTRSNKHPIDVHGSWSSGYLSYLKADTTLAEIRSFVGLVNGHMGRWRHVTLELVSNIPLGPTGGPAPLLETLEVYDGVSSPGVDELVTLFPTAWTPRLREVSINGLELVQLDMPFPPTLTRLIITGVKYWTPSFSKLLTILMACPGLTALELSAYCGTDWIKDEGWTTCPTAKLPLLRELKIRRMGKLVIRAILQRLQFPHECVVQLSSKFFDIEPSADFTSTLAHHLDDLRTGGINQITIIIERFQIVMRAQGPRWNMELEVGGFDGVRDIVLLFNPEGTTCGEGLPRDRIPVTLEFRRDVLVSWVLGRLSELSDLGSIATLKVDASQGAHVAILSHLGGPAIKEGVMPVWPLPGLRELHIKRPMVEIDPVIKFVKSRRGKSDRLGAPVPLQRIEFEGEQVEGRDLSPLVPIKQARPDSLLDLLKLLDWSAQVIWYGERVQWE